MAQCAICGAPLPDDVTAKDGKCRDCWRKIMSSGEESNNLPRWSPPANPRRRSGIDYMFPNDDDDDE